MITQAIKGWLRRMFAWWPWKQSSANSYSHAVSPFSKGFSQEPAPRSTIDGIAPQAGITPRLSTIEEQWPERVDRSQPYLPETGEPAERPLLPLPPPAELIEEKQRADTEGVAGVREAAGMQSSKPEQQLEFLQYLVRRGIVNEGFEKGNEPEQYRRA